MLSVSNKLVSGLFLCLFSLQAGAQNAQATAAAREQAAKLLNGGYDFSKLTANAPKTWQTSKYFNTDRQQGLNEILNSVKDQFKNPRLQTLEGGSHGGGGGNTLICEKDGKIYTQLLDLYEANKSELNVDMGPGDFKQKLQYVFSRLSKVTNVHAGYYSAIARDLLTKNTEWAENSTMPVINDIKLATLPRGCTIVQVAIQRPVEDRNVPNARIFIIDKDVFNLLDEDSKAALIIHEVIYRTARYSGQVNSVFTRYLTALIVSKQITEYDKHSYTQILQKNSITCNEHEFLPALVSSGYINEKKSTYKDTCDYANESPTTLKTGPILDPIENLPMFNFLEGTISEVVKHYRGYGNTYEVSSYSRTLATFIENFYGQNIGSFRHLFPEKFVSEQTINTYFTLKGKLVTTTQENKKISMTIQNSLIGISEDGTQKLIIGSITMQLPGFKLYTESGNILHQLNNYAVSWNEYFCLYKAETTNNRSPFPQCKKFGTMIQFHQYSSYDVDMPGIKNKKIANPGDGYMKVKIPQNWNIDGTDKEGWMDIDGVVFDNATGDIHEVFKYITGEANKESVLNFKTRETSERDSTKRND